MPALFLAGIAAFLALGVAGLAAARHENGPLAVYGAAGGLAALLCVLAGYVLAAAGGPSPELVLPLGLPRIGAHFRVDALSAAFLVVVNLGACAASLFAFGNGRGEREPERILPFYPLFLAGMNLVVLAADAFTFLLGWEFMSLVSWALVLAHHRAAGNVRAGYVYLMMAGFGTLMLLLAFGLLAGHVGTYEFGAMRVSAPDPRVAGIVLVLALLGAGSKAGLVPLHVWLPLAHPAAPSHVSALMSGVMTKVAVYGFVRIVFDLLGPPEWWWGMPVLALGGLTSVLGVLYALMQHDLKRLFAYHTVENIGIIFTGLGLALAFKANFMQAAAALALDRGAVPRAQPHVVQEPAVLRRRRGARRDRRARHGAARRPHLYDALDRLRVSRRIGRDLGAAAAQRVRVGMADLPGDPLEPDPAAMGSEADGAGDRRDARVAAALAAACFVKAFGITFLGRPRSPAAMRAREVDGFSLAAMLALVALCVLCGILPGFVIDALAGVVQPLAGGRMPVQSDIPWLSIVPVEEARSSYNPLLVFVFIAAAGWLSAIAVHRWASRAVRRGPAWDCGFPDPSPQTEYTAASFAQPIRRVFGTLVFRARESVDMPAPGEMRPARFDVVVRDLIWDGLYAPISVAVGTVATRLNVVQSLTIRRYLALVFVTLVGLLAALAVAP